MPDYKDEGINYDCLILLIAKTGMRFSEVYEEEQIKSMKSMKVKELQSIRHYLGEYRREYNDDILDSISDEIPFAEERRLFYVALTITRNKVYLVVPNSRTSKSEFINEIESMI